MCLRSGCYNYVRHNIGELQHISLQYGIFCSMSGLNLKYFVTSKIDGIFKFVKEHLAWLIAFSCFLVFGLVMGVLSSLKPIDPQEALASVNSGMYALIVQASFAGYIFPLLIFTLISVTVFCFVGRFSHSVILTVSFTVAVGFFQGSTLVLVMRSFGLLALPLAIAYVVMSIITDLIYFALFARLARIAAEKRKYGCGTPFLPVLKSSVVIFVFCVVSVVVKSVLVILFSFFL